MEATATTQRRRASRQPADAAVIRIEMKDGMGHPRWVTADLLDITDGGFGLALMTPVAAGASVVVRDPEHTAALERVVLDQFTSKRPCDKKAHVGVSDAALTEAARLLGDAGRTVNVDLEDYARLVAS